MFTTTEIQGYHVTWLPGDGFYAVSQLEDGEYEYYPILYWCGTLIAPGEGPATDRFPHLIGMVPFGAEIVQATQLPDFLGYSRSLTDKAVYGPPGFQFPPKDDTKDDAKKE